MQNNKPKVSRSVRFVMFWVRHVQQCLASLGEMWRTPSASLMTIAVLAVCLSLPATFYLMVKNLYQVSAYWQSSTQLTVYLKNEVTPARLEALSAQLNARPELASVELIDKAQGLSEFEQSSGFNNILSLLPANPLPDVLVLQLNPQNNSSDDAKRLQNELSAWPEVATVNLDVVWLERLEALLSLLNKVASLLAALLLAAIALIIINTLRLNIFNRRNEIEVMKLVGATDGFIRRPFLYTGLWYGVIGCLGATVLCNILLIWSEYALGQFGLLYQRQITLGGFTLNEFLTFLGFACLLSLSATLYSVQKHIREIEPS